MRRRKGPSLKYHSLLVLFTDCLVLNEDSIIDVFLFFGLVADGDELLILSPSSIEVELADDAEKVRSGVIMDIVDGEGMAVGDGCDDL